MKKIRLNHFVNICPSSKKIIISTRSKIITITDKVCIDLIRKLLNKQATGEPSHAEIEDKILKNKNVTLLLSEGVILDNGVNSPKEALALYGFFVNPNFNGVQTKYDEALRLTNKAHPKIIDWAPSKRPKRVRYSCRRFKNKKVNFELLSKIAIRSYGIMWQQKIQPYIIHTPIASSGAMYPLNFFFIIKNEKDYKVYFFNENKNKLDLYCKVTEDAFKKCLVPDLEQGCINAPNFVLIIGDISLISQKYGYRGLYYAILEAGALSHQLSEVMRSYNIQSVHLGGYYEEKMSECLKIKLAANTVPLLLIAFGYEA